MDRSLETMARLWWGPLRRPFEALSRRMWGKEHRIQFGPLRGAYVSGGLSQILGIYEIHVQRALGANLTEGDIFYDIGANNGYLSLLGVHIVGRQGQVYAFEPFPANVRAIKEVIERNGIENCEVLAQAIADKVGTMTLYAESTESSATPSLILTDSGQQFDVLTTTLDEFAATHPLPTMVKLDVEGAELMVLEAAENLLAHDPAPTWLIEIHTPKNDHEVKSLLANHNYEWHDVPSPRRREDGYPCHILAWHKK